MNYHKIITWLTVLCAFSGIAMTAVGQDQPASGVTNDLQASQEMQEMQEIQETQEAQEIQVKPWMDTALGADARAQLVIKEMTMDEKLRLLSGYFGDDLPHKGYTRHPQARPDSAGYVEGVPRLGIPALYQADGGIGVASQPSDNPREHTALPSGIATAATWNPELAFQGGAMIGSEARAAGFNVLLGGSVNLMRDPRNGRSFEYAGEDPYLAGVIVGAQIKGIQSNNIISTLKHFALNDQETGRMVVDVKIGDAAARMSDLLALQLAYEIGSPGSVMCAYNRVNGAYACENDYLLNQVLKRDWGFKGWVMSDWGAVHSTIPAANAGLDQQSGAQFDQSHYFGGALKEAVENGHVSQARFDDMVFRILRAMFAKGLVDHPINMSPIDFAANAAISQADAEEAIVLLKNANKILPLGTAVQKLAIIGGHADVGVLSGGGSSQVYPVGGMAVKGLGPKTWPGPMVYHPSSPMKAIKARLPDAQVKFDSGTDIASAVALAEASDFAIVFAQQWMAESIDVPNLSLPDNQDALIDAVAKANPNTIVILQTGGPVLMPWLEQVAGVLEAWYPGTAGGEAIARIVFGEVSPSGRLPVTFPAAENQLPREKVDGDPSKPHQRFTTTYHEGAAVGYKWFDLKSHKPLFPFGSGMSYTDFSYGDLAAQVNETGQVNVSFTIKNSGVVAGKDVPQIYLSAQKDLWEAPKRLVAFQKVALEPGESKTVSLTIDPRLLAVYDSKDKVWKITKGEYQVLLSRSALEPQASIPLRLPGGVVNLQGK